LEGFSLQKSLKPASELLLAGVLIAVSSLPSFAANERPMRVLWAWQRAEDLRCIDPNEFGVAYMACRVLLSGDHVSIDWRKQPLHVPEETFVEATIRVDVEHRHPCALNAQQRNAIVWVLRTVANSRRVKQVQIDFDALLTERGFYREVIREARNKLPPDMPLSITSLASWCIFDDWTSDLPIDESVPMMFSLGPERQKVLNYFGSRRDFRVPRCKHAMGLSLEEPDINALMIPLVQQRTMPCRVYVFTKTAWTKKKVDAVREMLGIK
jgi:hypothetical protein